MMNFILIYYVFQLKILNVSNRDSLQVKKYMLSVCTKFGNVISVLHQK